MSEAEKQKKERLAEDNSEKKEEEDLEKDMMWNANLLHIFI